MPRKSAQASTSAACMASVLGTPKCRNIRVLNSLKASTGKLFVSTSVMFILDHREIYAGTARPGTGWQSADGKYVVPSKFASNRKVGQYRTIVGINVRTRPNLPPTGAPQIRQPHPKRKLPRAVRLE